MRGFIWMLVTAALAAGGFYILREHWGHFWGLAPYLLFLACPIVHLFLHRGHGSDQGAHHGKPAQHDTEQR